METALEIKPLEGISSLAFGSGVQEAEQLFGQAEEKERLDDTDDRATVLHYWEKGFSLFFTGPDENSFTSAEVSDADSVLWGKKVFGMTEGEIIGLFSEKGYPAPDSEIHDWGEKRVSFEDAFVDMYFENDELISVNFARPEREDRIVIFPN